MNNITAWRGVKDIDPNLLEELYIIDDGHAHGPGMYMSVDKSKLGEYYLNYKHWGFVSQYSVELVDTIVIKDGELISGGTEELNTRLLLNKNYNEEIAELNKKKGTINFWEDVRYINGTKEEKNKIIQEINEYNNKLKNSENYKKINNSISQIWKESGPNFKAIKELNNKCTVLLHDDMVIIKKPVKITLNSFSVYSKEKYLKELFKEVEGDLFDDRLENISPIYLDKVSYILNKCKLEEFN